MNKPQQPSLLIPLALFLLAQIFLVQSQWAWTLWPGLVFVYLGFWKLKTAPSSIEIKEPRNGIKPKREAILFFLILSLSLFFRLYRLDSLPPGMHTDQGLIGLFAQKILHEGWRPIHEILASQVPNLLLTYQLAGWFGLAGDSPHSFHLFFVFFSLLSFPFIYWASRQWSGMRVALISIFILAVMRWNWITVRNALSVEVSFYTFGTIALFYFGVKKGHFYSLLGSFLLCGFGLYNYQALKALPLLLVLLTVFELSQPLGNKFSRQTFLSLFFLLTLLAAPLLNDMALHHTWGKRESEASLLSRVMGEKSLSPLLEVWGGTALMLNRTGDPYPLVNIPGLRMVDDVTGVLFLLGLALVWRLRKQREGFYPLSGFMVMALPGLLSSSGAASNRVVGCVPFVAYFAGLAAETLLKEFTKRKIKKLPLVSGILLILLWVVGHNTYTYFTVQANDSRCQRAFGLEQNFIGQTIRLYEEGNQGQARYFVGPFYFHNPTVDFLAYPYRKKIAGLSPADWAQGNFPRDKEAVLFLEPGQNGTLAFFKTLFPTMSVEPFLDPDRRILLTQCLIPPKALQDAKPWNRGLNGVYIPSNQWTETPGFTRLDPVLNFSSYQDFGFSVLSPCRIRWTGTLNLNKPGSYQFQVLTEDRGALWLDGKEVPLEKHLFLKAGTHSLKLEYEKDSGYYAQLHLVWKKPGDEKWEVVPAEAFGKPGP